MPHTLFLARHGETVWNRDSRKQGQSDSPLTPRGLLQAERLGEELSHAGIDVIFTSPLGRAFSTATIAAERIGVEIIAVDRLAEIDYGDYTGMGADEYEAQPGWSPEAKRSLTWKCPGGESYEDLDRRAVEALRFIGSYDARTALVVSHQTFGRMLVKNLCGWRFDDALAHKHPHGTVYRWDASAPAELAIECDDRVAERQN